MRRKDAVDRKPDIFPPATPISTPSTTFNPNSTILELILKLRSCFQLKDSEEVAAILQSREDKLKQTISDLKNREDKLNMNNIELKSQLQALAKKCASFEASGEKFGAGKQLIEAELKKCEAVCEEYRDKQLSAKYELEKVRLDLKMLREKEEMNVERYEKRIGELEKERKEESERLRKVREELEKERVKRKEEVDKLKGEFAGLIDGKKKAGESASYWERNYKQCEPRVMKLERYLSMLMRSDPALAKIVEEQVLLISSPPVINPKSVINGNPELVERQKQSNLSKCDENAHASPCAGSTAESPIVDTNGPAETGPNSSVMACANRMPTENQVVIEIDDSDDEKPIIETASASKMDKDYGRGCEKDPASQSISRGKHPLVCTQDNGDVDGSNKNKKRKMDSPFSHKAYKNFDSSDESITTLDMEKLVSKIVKNKSFSFDVDMLTAFNKDDELCLHAVCALHRVEKCDKLPQYRGFSAIDATRESHLAKFLINGDPQGKLRKSVNELQQYDSKGIDECRKLARNYFKQLFQIYQNEEDPFFKEYLVKNYPKKTIS